MRVLLAEKEPFISRVYQNKLADEGFEVHPVYDGRSALQKVLAEKFDLILLSICTSDIDGIGILKSLRKHRNIEFACSTVVLIAEFGNRGELEQAMAYGANDYIAKEYYAPHELVRRIKALAKG